MMPEPVLQAAAAELPNWRGRGVSVMECSHRAKPFVEMAHQAEADLRALLDIPDEYAVLFMHGGACGQFSAVPMNLSRADAKADYAMTGHWSGRAISEARLHLGEVGTVCELERSSSGARIPPLTQWRLNPDADYLHYTPNETIDGVEFHWIPESETPLVADMSSCILSQPLDVRKFALIYASAQKNIGPAGLTLVIVKRSLLSGARDGTPSILDYTKVCAADSMLNTPPTFAWYMSGQVFQWLLEQGGLEEIQRRNAIKADKLYNYIDAEDFYSNEVAGECRSRMNVPFKLADADREASFLEESEDAGLLNLKGHRSVGGMRASLYNALPEAAVDALIEFMREFVRTRA